MIHLDIQDADVARAIEVALSRAESPRAAFDELGGAWLSSVDRNFREGGRPQRWNRRSGGGRSTLQQSRRLQRSISARTLIDGVQVGTRSKYGRIQQEGGTIRPRRRKFLSIPLPDTAKALAAGGAGVAFRRYPGRVFTIWKGGDKGTVMLKSSKRSDDAKPIFVLRKRVKLPARPFLLAHAEDLQEFTEILLRHATGSFE